MPAFGERSLMRIASELSGVKFLDAIVTRDLQGFVGSSVPVLSVRQLLEQLEQSE